MTSLSDVLAGRYRLTELLGQGGMSDVYRAVDERTGMAVAVKIVRSGDPEFARRLAQEARALERFEHPGLVRLLHTGVTGAQAYLVMELIDGSTLADVLRRRRLDSAATARIGALLAGALAYVHARGIVHRDVKPANILVTSVGEARLGDFGIARLMDASTLTVAGTTLGTVAYMAPEQLEDHQVGPSADIWSLGIVLLECLIGRRVYDGTPTEVMAKRLAGPVPLPSDLPTPWRLLLSGMLDHRPRSRLDGDEIAALLESPVFATPWEPSAATANGRRQPLGPPSDLTALVPMTGSPPTVVAGDDTRVAALGTAPEPMRRRSRRWLLAVLAAVLMAGLGVGLFFAFRSGPTTHGTTAHGKNPASSHTAPPARAATTSTAATTTTTTIPTAPTALAALTRDVGAAVDAGTMGTGTGNAITGPAGRAVVDEQAGKTKQATTQMQQAASVIADGVQNGSISPAEGTQLQADISTLADVLGVVPTTTVPTSPAGPGPGNGNGGGAGQGN